MTKKFKLHGSDLEVQVSGYAGQADGEAWLQCGKSVVFSTVVASKKETDYLGFLPLSVEFRKRPSAAGKFPSGFIKREGRLSDRETLASRVIDRSIRPFFPVNFFNEVQVISTVFSSDGLFPPVVMGVLSASIALITSGIPFLGPVGAVQLCRIDGEWVVNPSYAITKDSMDLITISGSKDGLCMVEGKCDQISEDELLKVLNIAKQAIKIQLDWQEEIKREFAVPQQLLGSQLDFNAWSAKVRQYLPKDWSTILFTSDKKVLGKNIDEIKQLVLANFQQEIADGIISKAVLELLFDIAIKQIIPNTVVEAGKRFDDRAFNKVRAISGTVGLLPAAHGSATFRRGDTHAISSVSLGTGSDAQKEDSLFESNLERTFMLHYNFPPFSTGEAKPMRGVGRREIGHGYLAERSFYSVLPAEGKFPYTIRSVVDILECYGSSSMATACATTLALMDAGVPIRSMVAGIAMGLFGTTDGRFAVLSDISGSEDAYGLMDFKVIGTENGITAFQMDVKAKAGIPEDVLVKALFEAKVGRLHILSEMKKVISAPRNDVAETAPRVFVIKINPEKIGMLIGPGGKNIKEITASTGAQIDIEDDGTVKIYAQSKEIADKALGMVRGTTGEIEVGFSCNGQIRGITDFGMFVEIVPGKDGLVHVSSMSKHFKDNFAKEFKIGDKLEVIVESSDKATGRIKLNAPSLK